jgi:hypothetical protein
MMLLKFSPLAFVLLVCFWNRAAADSPVPQPSESPSPACQFDTNAGFYDLAALNVKITSLYSTRPSTSFAETWQANSANQLGHDLFFSMLDHSSK